MPTSSAQALEWQRNAVERLVKVYAEDGVTVIDTMAVGGVRNDQQVVIVEK